MSDKNKKSSFASALKEKYGDFKKAYKKSQKQYDNTEDKPLSEQINFGGKYKKKKSSGY